MSYAHRHKRYLARDSLSSAITHLIRAEHQIETPTQTPARNYRRALTAIERAQARLDEAKRAIGDLMAVHAEGGVHG